MKKIISLLLAVVLCLGMLAGITMAADKPIECTEADAEVKVTDGEGNTYFFPVFSNEVLAWGLKELPGEKVFLLTRDVVLDPENGSSATNYFSFPTGFGSYYGNSATGPIKNPTIIDLGGHTVECNNEAAFVNISRYGTTVRNGTIVFAVTSGRSCFALGTTTGQTGFTNGSAQWEPVLNLENLNVINKAATGFIVMNSVWGAQINIKNCQMISLNGKPVLNLYATDQSKIGNVTPFTGDFISVCTIENSVLASNKDYAFSVKRDEQTIKMKDSLIVSNGKEATMYNKKTMPIVEGDAKELGAWTGTVAGQNISGNGFVIGNNPLNVELPFTDVKEGDWFFSFVSEMYGKKIINGMTETTFVPNGTLTYGQALKLIAMGLGEAEQPAGAHWASGYLTLAKDRGWLATDVDLNGPVTRLAFCQIAAKAKGLTEKAENPFKDTNDDSVLALVKAGVISGMSADTFAPNATLTRAQIAKIISLLIKL